MKFCVFFAQKELRRRPSVFLSGFYVAGAAIFCLVSLFCMVLGRRGMDAVDGQWILLLLMAGLYIIFACTALGADRYRRYRDSYRALLDVGMPQGGLIIISGVQMTITYAAALAVFVPLAMLFVQLLMRGYNAAAAAQGLDSRWHIGVSLAHLAGFAGILYAAQWIAVLLAYALSRKMLLGESGGRYPFRGNALLFGRPGLGTLSRVCRSRGSRCTCFSRLTLMMVQILPMLFVCAALDAGPRRLETLTGPFNQLLYFGIAILLMIAAVMVTRLLAGDYVRLLMRHMQIFRMIGTSERHIRRIIFLDVTQFLMCSGGIAAMVGVGAYLGMDAMGGGHMYAGKLIAAGAVLIAVMAVSVWIARGALGRPCEEAVYD